MTAFTARDSPDPALPRLRERAEAVWMLATLGHEYRRFLARFSGIAVAFDKRTTDAEQAFVVRTLLVHAYRRVRLRDPQLPREVLADDWPGAHAYELARALYRIAAPRAEAFVKTVLGEEAEVALRKPTNPELRFADPA